MARMRSKSSKSAGSTWRAAPVSSIPRRRAASVARASGGSPACQPPVPALSSSTRSSRPSSRSSLRITPSAVGERQMLPMQTKRMRIGASLAERRPALRRAERAALRARRDLAQALRARADVLVDGRLHAPALEEHVDRLDHEEEQDRRDNDEGQQRVDEVPVQERAAVDREVQRAEVLLADDRGDERRDEVLDERVDDRRERGADDHRDRQVDEVAAQDEGAELLEDAGHGPTLTTGPAYIHSRSRGAARRCRRPSNRSTGTPTSSAG